MRVCLMADIPDQPITRRVEYIMHCDGELYSSKRSACVSSDARACIDDELSNLVSYFLKVLDL